MADPPAWGFADLDSTTRWILGQGLPTTLSPPRVPLDDPAWQRCLLQCSAHRLSGHLIAVVANGSLPVTNAQKREAAGIECELTERRIRYDEICRSALAALDNAAVPYRLIKGSALPWSDYPDPQLRPTGDLDLLVPAAQLHDALVSLEALGGTLVNPEPTERFARLVFKGLTVQLPSGLEVDLHRILSWGPFGVRVPEADLWSPGRTVNSLGAPHLTFDIERTLLHVCAHLLLLGAIRASEVRDVAQVACSVDLNPERTVAIARRWGQEAVLATALRMAERELALAPGSHQLSDWAASYHVSIRDRTWLRIDRPDAPIGGIEPLAVLVELRGLRARIELLKAIVRPRPGTDPSLAIRLRGFAKRAVHSLRRRLESIRSRHSR